MTFYSALALTACIWLAAAPSSYAVEDALLKIKAHASSQGTGIEARAEAMRAAQERVLVETLSGSLGTDDLLPFKALIDNAPKYIQSTQLLQYDTSQGQTEVEIESYVRQKVLLEDAAAALLPRLPAPPTVLIVIAEQAAPDQPLSAAQPGAAERALAEPIRKARLAVVDAAPVRACHTDAELLAAIQGDAEAAGRFAREGFADAVILGEARWTFGGEAETGGVGEAKAALSLRVVRGYDGKTLDTLAREAVVHSGKREEGVAAAIEDACGKLAPDAALSATLAGALAGNTSDVTITIERPESRARFDAVLKNAAEATQNAEMEVLLYSDTLARVRIRYAGPMAPLMAAVADREYDGRMLEVERAVGRTALLRFAS